jgi:hypothetical protein
MARDNLRETSGRDEPEPIMQALRTAGYQAWSRHEDAKKEPPAAVTHGGDGHTTLPVKTARDRCKRRSQKVVTRIRGLTKRGPPGHLAIRACVEQIVVI